MHVDFDPLQIDWSGFTTRTDGEGSVGGGFMMTGGGSAGYPVFTGLPYQRGAGGLGSMFRSFLRFLLPIGRQAGIAIGRQGLQSGSNVLSQVLEGKDLKESLEHEGRAGLRNLLSKAADNIGRQQQQKGSGNFDFKRYKKQLESRDSSIQEPSSAGIGRSIKRRIKTGLFSTVGPRGIASIRNNKPQSKSNKRRASTRKKLKTVKGKHLHVDSLGAY